MMNLIDKIKTHTLENLLSKLDYYCGLGFLERLLFINWLNPFCTIYINFRSFPICQAIRFPIFVYGRPRIYGLSGKMIVTGCKITPGMIKFNQVKVGAPSNMSLQSEIFNRGLIIFRGNGFIGTGNKICVFPNAVLDLGASFKIAGMCNIACFSSIKLGVRTRIAHRCQILDTNYHYVANFIKRIVPPFSVPITIGNSCWICNSTTIMSGVILPDYTIVTSNSLVNRKFSEISKGSLIGGIPAKFIATGFRRVENIDIENRVRHFYYRNTDKVFEIFSDDTPDVYSDDIKINNV